MFAPAERYAVFTAHRERRWLCGTAVALGGMQVDHMIPESLEVTSRLAQVVADLGRPVHFNVNSYANWAPSRSNAVRLGVHY